MCYAAGLTAQQADQDQPNEPPDSSESASSAIAPAPIYAPLDRTQKYFCSFNEMTGPTQWIGFAVHAAMDQARKSPGAWGNGADSFSVRMANAFCAKTSRLACAPWTGKIRVTSGSKTALPESVRSTPLPARLWLGTTTENGCRPYSRLAADYATPFLAQTWRPEKFGIGRGFRGGSVAVGIGFGSNLWQEFWPDLKKKVKGSKRFPGTAQWWKPAWL
jgi:hypothetical protein